MIIFIGERQIALIMEFCPKTLQQWLKDQNTESTVIENRKERLSFFNMTCQGLNYVHSLGLIHRDLKPSNILLTSENIIRIADFGLAREECSDKYTLNVGTDLYRPTEQRSTNYDKTVDIFSLGE